MNNVAAGNFIDDETGESLNDVETVLGELGIALRDTNGLFRNSGEILDEVSGKWSTFNNVQQHAIATAFAGTRQQEKFIVLMENYASATDYAATAANSAGTAMAKYEDYLAGVEASMTNLKAAFEEFSIAVLDSGIITSIVDVLAGVVNVLTDIASIGGGFITRTLTILTLLALLTVAFETSKAAITKLILKYAELNGVQTAGIVTTKVFKAAMVELSSTGILGLILAIPKAIIGLISLVAQFGMAEVAALGLKGALELLEINPVMLAITAITATIVGAVAAIKNYQEELVNSAKQSQAVVDATAALDKKLKEENDTLDSLIDSYRELAEKSRGAYDAEQQQEVLDLQNRINAIIQEQGESVDLLNTKYENLSDTIKKLAGAQSNKLTSSINETKESIQIIIDEAKKVIDDMSVGPDLKGVEGLDENTTIEDAIAILTGYTDRHDLYGKHAAEAINKLTWYQDKISELEGSIVSFIVSKEDAEARVSGAITNWLGDDAAISSLAEYSAYKQALIEAAMASEDFAVSNEKAANEVERFLSTEYGDVIAKLASDLRGTNYQLKGFSNLAEKATAEFDALSAGFADMEERGSLSLDTYKDLLEVFPDLASMQFVDDDNNTVKFLEETEDGYYKLNGSIEKYIALEQEKLVAVMASNAEGSAAYNNAYSDLQDLIAIQNTLLLDDSIQKAQDRLNEQLEEFEKIIDVRKELLSTYKQEIDYQRELESRQRNVTSLQTKLSVSRLDTSAAGQARTRELEQQLKEAQEELDDFTLEHAIDVLTTQLDLEKEEYKALIDSEIQELKSISGSMDSIDGKIASLLKLRADDSQKGKEDSAKLAFNDLQAYVLDKKFTAGGEKDDEYTDKLNNAVKAHNAAYSDNQTDAAALAGQLTWHVEPAAQNDDAPPPGYKYISAAKKSGTDNIRSASGNNFVIDINEVTYAVQSNGSTLNAEQAANAQKTVKAGGGIVQEGTVVAIGTGDTKVPYVYTKDGDWVGMANRPGFLGLGDTTGYSNLLKVIHQYHTGGFVGDETTLKSNEEFAKLLKGEFVSTPAQMKRFMETTLPNIASYTSNGGSNEFNAPLIEINCDNVTGESIPDLKRIVNDAVDEIKKQLDTGMSRTGFVRTSRRLV